jgi:hypothetical protein
MIRTTIAVAGLAIALINPAFSQESPYSFVRGIRRRRQRNAPARIPTSSVRSRPIASGILRSRPKASSMATAPLVSRTAGPGALQPPDHARSASPLTLIHPMAQE